MAILQLSRITHRKGLSENLPQLAGAEFGWYGEINFYYLAGFDYRSRFIYNRDNNDYTKLLGEKTDWVFIDENSIKTHNRIR